jgi:hypothetical protein
VLADSSVNCAPVEQLLSIPRMMRATDGTQILNVSPVSCKSNNVCKSNVQQIKTYISHNKGRSFAVCDRTQTRDYRN